VRLSPIIRLCLYDILSYDRQFSRSSDRGGVLFYFFTARRLEPEMGGRRGILIVNACVLSKNRSWTQKFFFCNFKHQNWSLQNRTNILNDGTKLNREPESKQKKYNYAVVQVQVKNDFKIRIFLRNLNSSVIDFQVKYRYRRYTE